jgi:hypothetical protein
MKGAAMKVEERTPLALRGGLMEAIAWRWVAEWFGRHPQDLWLRRIASPDHGELLRIFVVGPRYEGHHADLPLEGPHPVRVYTSDWQFEVPGLTEMALESESPHEVVDHLCSDLELVCHHRPLPETNTRTLCYQVIAGLLASTAFDADRWRCMSVVGGSLGSASPVLREDLLEPFGRVAPTVPRHAYPPDALDEEAFGIWVITRNDEPRVCLTESGIGYFHGGGELDFGKLFEGTRRQGEPSRIAPVVAALGERFLP